MSLPRRLAPDPADPSGGESRPRSRSSPRKVTETHSAAEGNAELEGARKPGGGAGHGRETPTDQRDDDRTDEEMAPVAGVFPADSAQPTQHRHNPEPDAAPDSAANPAPDETPDESRDFGRPHPVAPPAEGAPSRRIPVTGGDAGSDNPHPRATPSPPESP